MSQQKPFLFDRRSFDAELGKPVAAEEQPRYSQQSFDQAVEAAEARGISRGMEQARDLSEQQIANQLVQINQQMQNFMLEQSTRDAAAQALAVEVALGLVRKLVPDLLNQPAIESMAQFIRQALAEHYEETKLIIRVHESVMDAVHQRIQTLPELMRVQDKYALVSDPHLAPPDCRVEWPSGGIERHISRLWQQLEAATSQLAMQLKPAALQTDQLTGTVTVGVGHGG